LLFELLTYYGGVLRVFFEVSEKFAVCFIDRWGSGSVGGGGSFGRVRYAGAGITSAKWQLEPPPRVEGMARAFA
jgi:hypothetical protein